MDCFSPLDDVEMGMVEEMGEIAHAMLKWKQGIRIEDNLQAGE